MNRRALRSPGRARGPSERRIACVCCFGAVPPKAEGRGKEPGVIRVSIDVSGGGELTAITVFEGLPVTFYAA